MPSRCDCTICKRGRAIVAGETKMDSPNTRSRTKRALEEDTGSGLEWRHDQDLRRAALEASEMEQLELPAPTQKPRPAVSSLALSPSQIASSSTRFSGPSTLGTLGPRRKRPCRSTKLTINGDVQVSRIASTTPSGSSKGLKAILDQFAGVQLDQTQLVVDSPGAVPPSATLADDTSPFHGVLSPRSLNAHHANSPLAQRSSTKLTGTGMTKPLVSPNPRHKPLARHTSSRSSLTSDTPNTPKSPIARTGSAPRIGLRSTKSAQSVPSRVQQPFKPPLIVQPVRSSPRRQPLHDATPSNSPLSNSSRKSIPTPSRCPDQPPDSKSPKLPSSDGVGDDSFDWDEALQNAELVGMVDGM